MIRKGTHVKRLTKKVGQTAPTGLVVEIRDENYIEVRWDDGHMSLVTKDAVVPVSTNDHARKAS